MSGGAGHSCRREDLHAVVEAMRSTEWLRTQWIARAAFLLRSGARRPRPQVALALRVLRVLHEAGVVERRDAVEGRRGPVTGIRVSLSIPRDEWRLIAPPPSSPSWGSRQVEEAALAIVIERLPNPMSAAALCEWMTTMVGAPATPARLSAIRLAILGLVAVGLLSFGEDGSIIPTPAALRAAELDIGL